MRATTPPQPAVELIMRYLAAMRSGDRPTGYGFFAEDIVLHVPGRSAAAGVHRGRDAAVRCIESAVAASHGGKVDVELVDMLANQERVVLIVRERFHRADGVVEIRRANVYRFRGETIAEVSVFEANQYEVDALLEREDSNPPESH
jgi:ketosteroid isomerase-like protein